MTRYRQNDTNCQQLRSFRLLTWKIGALGGALMRRLAGPARTALATFLAFLSLFAGGPAVAAAREPSLPLRYHQAADGLGNLVVNALLQDRDGSLWVGTENGLYRHEGDRLRALPFPTQNRSALIRSLAADGADGLWVVTGGGLYHRQRDGALSAVQPEGRRLSPVPGQSLARLGGSAVLLAATDGLWRVEPAERAEPGVAPERWQVVPALPAAVWAQLVRGSERPQLRSIFVDRQGAWWFGCDRVLYRWQGERLQRFGAAEGVSAGEWRGITETRDGQLWLRSQGQLLRWRPADGRFEDLTPAGLAGGASGYLPLLEDAQGRVLTVGDRQLHRWQQGRWQALGADAGPLYPGGVRALLQDRDGDIWIATAGRGLAQWRGYGRWTSWTAGPGLPADSAWAFAADSAGHTWMATTQGLARLAAGSETLDAGGSPTQEPVTALVRDPGGGLWALDETGQLFRRPAGRDSWAPVPVPPLPYADLLATEQALWVLTDDGLFTLPWPAAQGGGAPRLQRQPALDALLTVSRHLSAGCVDGRGQVWLAGPQGLIRHDPVRGFVQMQPAGLPAGVGIHDVECGRQGPIVSTWDETLFRIDTEGRHAEPIPLPLLAGRSIMALLEDRAGRLWLGTDGGLLVQADGRWRRFDDSNGLIWVDCNQGALAEGADGAIWVGTSNGISRIDHPGRLLAAPTALPLQLRSARVGNQPLAADTTTVLTGALDLHWFVPVYSNRAALRVRYRLHGQGLLDGPAGRWAETTLNELHIAHLDARPYRLELVAVNDDQARQSDPLRLAFGVRPPWWQRVPAQLGLVSAVALLLLAGHRLRLRRLTRRQAELEALVQARTRDLAESHERMRQLALTDALTGVMSRRAILDMAQQALDETQRGGSALTLVLLDLDHFKQVNDRHGHPAGDALLRGVAGRLQAALREGDGIGRYGGEEFLLLLPGLSLHDGDGLKRLDDLRHEVAARPQEVDNGQWLWASCSLGAAMARPSDGHGLDALIARADRALYRAKAQGRNQVQVDDS